jgi:hypothetical protein
MFSPLIHRLQNVIFKNSVGGDMSSVSFTPMAAACPLIDAIGQVALMNNMGPLRALVQHQLATWHVTPVQEPPHLVGYLPLHVAVHMNCASAVRLLLVAAPAGVHSFQNANNLTPLHLARQLLHIDLQTQETQQPGLLLLDIPARQSIVTSLSLYFIYAHIEFGIDFVTSEMRDILDDADTKHVLHMPLHDGKTLLHVAIFRRRPDIVKWLLEKGAAPHLRNAQDQSCLALSKSLDTPVTNGVETEIHRMVLHCVEHPDVFISYRQASETPIAKKIFEQLTGAPHYFSVFWDHTINNGQLNIYGIPPGETWDLYFARILTQSSVFAPIISYDGVVRRIIQNTHSQKRDNVLLEYIINRACHTEGHSSTVPLCIGPGGLAYPWDSFSFSFPPPVGPIPPDDPSVITTLQFN